MIDLSSEALPDEVKLALAHTPVSHRGALRMFFELDLRLGRLVSATTEPMLGQMRLAWWREMLAKPSKEWPEGDQVLDGIRSYWIGSAKRLIPVVDAWEHMLAEPPFEQSHAVSFCQGRQAALLGSLDVDEADPKYKTCCDAAWLWALADLTSKVSMTEERALLIDLATDSARPMRRLAKNQRGLAVLGALGRRSLKRGGRPLMEGRGAAIVALRAAITGM